MGDLSAYIGPASGAFIGLVGVAYGLHGKWSDAREKVITKEVEGQGATLEQQLAALARDVARLDAAQKEQVAQAATKESLGQLRADLNTTLTEVKSELRSMHDRFATKESVQHVAEGLADVKDLVRETSRNILDAIKGQGRGA